MSNLAGVTGIPGLSSNILSQPLAAATRASVDDAAVNSNPYAQTPDTPETRATADTELAKSYATALVTRSYHTSIAPPDVQVPPESTLGRWCTQLDSAFKSPGFFSWAKEQGLDTKSLKLDPARGELTGLVNGKMKTFSLQDDSGWSDISRVLLSIARAIAPMPGQVLNYPWPDGKLPLYTVGRFYAEPLDLSPSQSASYREQLKAGSVFKFASMGHASQRSVKALAEQGKELGDDANHQALLAALRSQVDDAEGKIDLNKVMVPIDRRSSLFLTEQRREISVAQLLNQQGYRPPGNSTEAHVLANALAFDLNHRSPGVDAGGVRHISKLLYDIELRKMQTVVAQWKKKRASQAPDPQARVAAGSVLHQLISTLPASTKKRAADNPSLVLDHVMRSPEAQALGKTLQNRINLAGPLMGAIEAVAAALLQELDPNPGKSPFNVAGYNLYHSDNMGISPAEIVKRFTAYLETKVGVEAAPVAAQLLLSAVAPEFLVKNIPPNLVCGSHTWHDFSIAVALVEQKAPGASGNMTFSQVLDFAEAQLKFLGDGGAVSAASTNALIAWGVANQVINSNPQGQYTFEEVAQSLASLTKQKNELAWARADLLTSAPTREDVALAEFKRVFPSVDPTKVTLCSKLDSKYVVSLLDVYMSKPVNLDWWRPIDKSDSSWEQIKSRFSELNERIDNTFSEQFEDYRKTHDSAWAVLFKYQVSLLPKVDKEFIEKSNVTFMVLSRPFLDMEGVGAYDGTVRRPRAPKPSELKALEGNHGVLMKVEGDNGKVEYYSYFPGLGKVLREKDFSGDLSNFDDKNFFGPNAKAREPGTRNVYKRFSTTHKERNPPGATGEEKSPYFSQRNGSLSAEVGKFFTKDYDSVKVRAFGKTRIEQNLKEHKVVNDLLLSLIPFYDGIKDAISGKIEGAAFNIIFDVLGFFIPGVNAASKAAKLGKSASKVLARSFFAGGGSSTGVTEAINLPKNIGRGAVAVGKDVTKVYKHMDTAVSRVAGHYKSYDVTRAYKNGDVVRGFHQVAPGGEREAIVAVLIKGFWYPYSTVTNTPFGLQLVQFGALSAVTPSKKE